MQPVIYADLRSLQDICYQRRGIGYHTAALLRARNGSSLNNWKLIGLVDSDFPDLPCDLVNLVDEISPCLNPCLNGAPAIFIDGSPMTHDTRFSLRFQNHPAVLKAAVLYDFIPLDWPGYLPTLAQRIEYSAKVARLCKFDLFFPISGYTAWRLAELTGVSGNRVKVTGASVRQSLYDARTQIVDSKSPYEQEEPYFVTLGGDDRRKNTDVAVKAVQHLNLLYGRRIPLKVIGHYGVSYKADLLGLAGHADGSGFLEFYPNISDTAVVELHVGALAAICPSRIEGFSLPVAEAAVCRCPVISSTCAAQIELVTQEEALFHSEDYLDLSSKLEALLNNPTLRESLVSGQAHLAQDFHTDEVGRRLWRTLEESVDQWNKAPRSHKPLVALLSPHPPDPIDGAVYTAGLMRALPEFAEASLFSATKRPLVSENGFEDAGFVTIAPLVDGRYNGIVSVLGNGPSYSEILRLFQDYGGPCILHDLRLHSTFLFLLGEQRFCQFCGEQSGEPLTQDALPTWIQKPSAVRTLLKHVIKRAHPLIVRSPTQQAMIKEWFGLDAHLATCCPTVSLRADEMTAEARRLSRERLNMADETFVISSFGPPSSRTSVQIGVLALELLRGWKIPAELYFVGNQQPFVFDIQQIAALYDVSPYLHIGEGFANDQIYRTFLSCSDVSLQLRDYEFGSSSSALTNVICAGVPAVATADMANSCQAPLFVQTVPDRFSPLQVAEQLAMAWERRTERSSHHEEERCLYLKTHNYEYNAKRLVEFLELR